MAHDFRNDDAVMAVRGAVQPVNRLGGDAECSIEANRCIGERDVVVNRLGQRDDVQTFFNQAQRVLVRAAAADADQRFEFVPLVVRHDRVGHVAHLAVKLHAMRLVAARAENRAADGENAREGPLVQAHAQILRKSAIAVAEAEDFHAVTAERGLANTANGGVETGRVAARRDDADASDFFHALFDLTTD